MGKRWQNVMANEKFSRARQEIVKNIYESLKSGTPVWKQPWFSVMRSMRSIATGKKYRGMNALILSLVAWSEKYTDSRWATFAYIESNGYHFVKPAKGKGVQIFKYVFADELHNKGADEEDSDDKDNKFMFVRTYTVFNVSLTDIPPETAGAVNEFDSIEAGEKMLDASPCPIHFGDEESYYQYERDEICLPDRERFFSAEEFYGTAFHELTHSTGSEKRLHRQIKNKFGSPEYAREELVAELGSVFLASMLGIQPSGDERKNNVAYLAGWMKQIEEEKKEKDFFDAVKDAENASDFLFALYEASAKTDSVQHHVLKYGTVSQTCGLCLLPVHEAV